MHLNIALMALSLLGTTFARTVSIRFFNNKEADCTGEWAQEYRTTLCNVCIRAPSAYSGVQVFGATDDERIDVHGQTSTSNACSGSSQIVQWYGYGCLSASKTPIQSVYVACEGSRMADNTTLVDDAVTKVVVNLD